VQRRFDFNQEVYEALVKYVGSLSFLFSENKAPLIHYRAAEEVFRRATNGKSVARADAAFDILVGRDFDIGVGVKTFLGKRPEAHEKVQEFTRMAGAGELENLSGRDLAEKVSLERNKKIQLAIREHGLDAEGHIYHCLVRENEGAYIHEEPYLEIDVDKLKITDRVGKRLSGPQENSSALFFSDGRALYSFRKAKNVLYKTFEIGRPSADQLIPISINLGIWDALVADIVEEDAVSQIAEFSAGPDLVPGVDFVVLPLFSTKRSVKYVPERSGINTWNARGRARRFGESYIPVPAKVRKLAPGFFPERSVDFKLQLPGRAQPVEASICQENDKALMANPNNVLLEWLYRVIDPSFVPAHLDQPPNRGPYVYQDLERAGTDCVIVLKRPIGSHCANFSISFGDLGGYEEFLDSFGNANREFE
jgi:hypothetical protein